jgi:hypothetical protein
MKASDFGIFWDCGASKQLKANDGEYGLVLAWRTVTLASERYSSRATFRASGLEGEKQGGAAWKQSLNECRRFRGEAPAFFCLPAHLDNILSRINSKVLLS